MVNGMIYNNEVLTGTTQLGLTATSSRMCAQMRKIWKYPFLKIHYEGLGGLLEM